MWLDVFIKINGAKVNWKNTQVLTLYSLVERQRITYGRKSLFSEQETDWVKVGDVVPVVSEFFSA